MKYMFFPCAMAKVRRNHLGEKDFLIDQAEREIRSELRMQTAWQGVRALLKAEGVSLTDQERALGVLSGCCMAALCKNTYLKFAVPVKIVWDGCDGYIEWYVAVESDDYKIYNGNLITRSESFTPFDVVQCSIDDVPTDEDGVKNFDGYFLTKSGNVYRL